jgi:hypothetical protein
VVMVTANVGVPRVHADTMRRSLGAFRRQVFEGSPQAVLDRLPDAIARELRAFDDWAEVPAGLRLQASTILEDAHAIAQAPKQARLARDLTAAQTFITGQLEGLDRLLKAPALQTPTARRVKAVLGGSRLLEAETAAVARARADIRAAAQTELGRIGKRMASKARELGSADEAVDAILSEELATAPKPLTGREAWAKAMGALYGDERKGMDLLKLAMDRGEVPRIATPLPTVDGLRAVDQALMQAQIPGLSGVRGDSRLTSWLAPDYQKALLKVAVDEGTKKGLAARGRFTEQLGSVIEAATTRAGAVPAGASRFIAALTEGRPFEVPRLRRGSIRRQRVYDVRQSHAERILAENGEEFAQFAEGIAPRARQALHTVLKEMLGSLLMTGRRNIVQNAQYGYVLPNVVGFPAALFRQALTPLLTVGLKDSGDIVRRVLRRRTFGGGLTTQDGVFYTGKQLHELAEQTGLGYSTVSSERVGSLADDLLRDARRAAEGPLAQVVKRELSPLDKSFWTRTAEAVEMSLRQAAFEAALIKGQAPRQAAETARRTFFDYSEVLPAIRDNLGQLFATAASNTKLYTELMRAIMSNPDKARIVLKAQLQKARAQDPYNLHGDKALKSLGLVEVGDGVFFGPELPGFAAPEVALGMARQADLLVEDLKQAQKASNQVGAVVDQVVQGGRLLTRTLADEALPGVLAAFDSFTEGEQYQTQGIQGAQPVSDEQMMWAAALYAHHIDQGRESGAWDWFERVFKPQFVPSPTGDQYWTKVPKGMPHLLWGRDEKNLPLYAVIEPSKDGLSALRVLRALTPNAMQRAIVGSTTAIDLQPREAAQPVMVFGGDALPSTPGQAVAETLLERAPAASPRAERQRQIQQIGEVMTGQ